MNNIPSFNVNPSKPYQQDAIMFLPWRILNYPHPPSGRYMARKKRKRKTSTGNEWPAAAMVCGGTVLKDSVMGL